MMINRSEVYEVYAVIDLETRLAAAQARLAELEGQADIALRVLGGEQDDTLAVDYAGTNWEKSPIAKAAYTTRAQLVALWEAAENVFNGFTPEHMDYVSGTQCGTELKAAIAAALAMQEPHRVE